MYTVKGKYGRNGKSTRTFYSQDGEVSVVQCSERKIVVFCVRQKSIPTKDTARNNNNNKYILVYLEKKKKKLKR